MTEAFHKDCPVAPDITQLCNKIDGLLTAMAAQTAANVESNKQTAGKEEFYQWIIRNFMYVVCILAIANSGSNIIDRFLNRGPAQAQAMEITK